MMRSTNLLTYLLTYLLTLSCSSH